MAAQTERLSRVRYSTDAQRTHAPIWQPPGRWKRKLVPRNPSQSRCTRTENAGPLRVTPWLTFPPSTELDADYLHRSDRGAFLAFARYMTHGHLQLAHSRQKRLKAHSPLNLWSESQEARNLAPHLKARHERRQARLRP